MFYLLHELELVRITGTPHAYAINHLCLDIDKKELTCYNALTIRWVIGYDLHSCIWSLGMQRASSETG